MSWDTAGAVTVAALGVVGTTLQYARRRDDSGGIKQDLEILAMLPPASEAHRVLSRHVEARVVRDVRFRETARRDRSGIWTALLMLVLGSFYLALGLAGGGGWLRVVWLASAVLFLLMGPFIAVMSVPKRIRDAKGIPVKEPG